MTPDATPTNIQVTDVPTAADIMPEVGVADGGSVTNHLGQPTGEKVVYEYDEQGNYVGFHKEAA